MKSQGLCYVIAGALLFFAAIRPAEGQEKMQAIGRADANQDVQFDVYLPLQHASELDGLLIALQTPSSPHYHKWLTPTEFRARFGARTKDIASVADALKSYGLEVTSTHGHGLHVKGKTSLVENTFGVHLSNAVSPTGRAKLVSDQKLSLPPVLSKVGAQIVHFSPLIRMHPHSQRLGSVPANRYSPIGGYWFDDLKQAYQYPSYRVLTGKGVTIGILMAGGYNLTDMNKYFHHERLATPKISQVKILGGAPFDPYFSFETHLDIQQAGGMAPGAHIVLFNLPDLSDDSILAGLRTIVERNSVDVVSMSFGAAEITYLAQYSGVNEQAILRLYEDLFKQGNAQGITFVASSGDLGAFAVPAADCFIPGAPSNCGAFKLSVIAPASSPHVTGVGGTNLVTTSDPPSRNSAYVRENAFPDPLAQDIFYGTAAEGGVWASGGGMSIFFKKPIYQFFVHSPSKFRTVPDLSLHMGGCPPGAISPCGPDRSFDLVAIVGQFFGVIGTSASAPDFAGLLALKVQRFGSRLGNENFEIYALAAAQFSGNLPFKVFHQGIPGSNGRYHTHRGYNLVLGNGTLIGKDFLLAPNIPSAGIPQTPTNP